ncbi:FAD binding domain-containing protein [Williamsia deligens]|uniref:FAD binding domain-containing protein n=1 Tax=Williamsia deligens TaxID=321325 RepID=A0ABW3G957_9NOCA|nr:FAD binding domain-containing protein [Williamsia deligens]MCP2193709.1 CO or xanthine dehydrogenase, FAD-binding subunit [Williamsia deligens]
MDLHFVDDVVRPTDRAGLTTVRPGDAILAGGTSVMADPGPGIRRLVDITTLGWPDLTIASDGLEIAATCTIDRLVHTGYPETWSATALFDWCARSLLASYKIWHTATVGGNICLALPAGAMTSMCSVLDASLLVWRADGTDATHRVDEVVVGNATTSLGTGDVLRSIHLPASALTSPVAMRRASYAEHGRSGAVVLARSTPDGVVVSVSGATVHPFAVPVSSTDPDVVVDACMAEIPDDAWFADAHGTVPWRRGVVPHLIRGVLADLSGRAS